MMLKQNKSGFTLVELIVVITILVILATIAFISLQSYSQDARNSKRLSDMNSISTSINTKQATGMALTNMVTSVTNNELATPAIAGIADATANYIAGTPSYNAIGIKQNDFLDPSTDTDYIIGVTSLVGGKYQIAATMEDGGTGYAHIVGNYAARDIGTGTGSSYATVSSVSGSKITISDGIGIFKVGDTVKSVTAVDGAGDALGKISSISADGTVITVDGTVSATASTYKVVLNSGAEVGGLIDSDSTSVTGTAVTHLGADLPY